MAISISQLGLFGNTRKVREYINSPSGQIEIYEPTVQDADVIIDLQREEGFDFGQDTIRFDELLVLKRLFPLLTNIETDKLSDEELNKIIENPSIHLLIAQNIVAQIISEVNKLYAERIKSEIIGAETVLAQAELISSIPNIIREQAKGDKELSALVDKVDRISESMDVEEIEEELDKVNEEISNS